ncbi:ribonuclease III domain-containing protein [Leptolyngbya sp. 'hensonii']|uniref:Mini-ribonuclease 3 n=1 Tax=Leptolyngbya sp. 'hensonii' TaxID=1922337 RepID=UPI000AA468B2
MNISEDHDSRESHLTWDQDLRAASRGLLFEVQSAQVQQLSPAALAYLGDAIYELYIRTAYLFPPQRLRDYHRQVVAQVRAEQQAHHLQFLHPYLNETELDILKRGRNAAAGGPKRVDPEIYQQATSLETLIGYLYLTDPQRLAQLLSRLNLEAETVHHHDSERS